MIIKQCALGVRETNTYLLVDEETGEGAVIDCPNDMEEMFNLIENTKELKHLKYLILTHGHFDHILGIPEFKEKYDIPVLICGEDKPCLGDGKVSLASYLGHKQTPVDADGTFADGDVLELGNLKIQVMHTPGHTVGSCCLIVDDVIFSGDTVFYDTVGTTTLPGGSMPVLLNSIERIKTLQGDYTILPGHDRKTSLNYERANNQYFNQN